MEESPERWRHALERRGRKCVNKEESTCEVKKKTDLWDTRGQPFRAAAEGEKREEEEVFKMIDNET